MLKCVINWDTKQNASRSSVLFKLGYMHAVYLAEKLSTSMQMILIDKQHLIHKRQCWKSHAVWVTQINLTLAHGSIFLFFFFLRGHITACNIGAMWGNTRHVQSTRGPKLVCLGWYFISAISFVNRMLRRGNVQMKCNPNEIQLKMLSAATVHSLWIRATVWGAQITSTEIWCKIVS